MTTGGGRMRSTSATAVLSDLEREQEGADLPVCAGPRTKTSGPQICGYINLSDVEKKCRPAAIPPRH
jgi:hypothetical protein